MQLSMALTMASQSSSVCLKEDSMSSSEGGWPPKVFVFPLARLVSMMEEDSNRASKESANSSHLLMSANTGCTFPVSFPDMATAAAGVDLFNLE